VSDSIVEIAVRFIMASGAAAYPAGIRSSWGGSLMRQHIPVVAVSVALLALVVGIAAVIAAAPENEIPLEFSGGHEIGADDFGRPVVLIAAALGVRNEQFREAFSGVIPAKGRKPSQEEASKNKAALMRVLAPLGVTNERLDEVSDYYRYQPQKGELWRTTSAKGYALVEQGKVSKIVITQPGAGYNSPPMVRIRGMEGVRLRAELSFSKDLTKNGAVQSVVQAE
jgi:hypothetical protein